MWWSNEVSSFWSVRPMEISFYYVSWLTSIQIDFNNVLWLNIVICCTSLSASSLWYFPVTYSNIETRLLIALLPTVLFRNILCFHLSSLSIELFQISSCCMLRFLFNVFLRVKWLNLPQRQWCVSLLCCILSIILVSIWFLSFNSSKAPLCLGCRYLTTMSKQSCLLLIIL